MSLILQAAYRNDEPLSVPLLGRFDERGGDIGRSDSATFTLPDAERLISRQQARVSFIDGVYWIDNVGAAAILHNGRPLSTGMRVALGEGDDLRIGDYRLTASFESDETSATILRGRPIAAPGGAIDQAAPAAVSAAKAQGSAANGKPAPASGAASPGAQAASVSADSRAPGSSAAGRAGRPARTRSPGAGSAPSAEDLWRSFQSGLGPELPQLAGPSLELFQAIGTMLRLSIAGLHGLLAMRSAAKNEMHAERTLIEMRGNNPLKFVSDPAVALQMLLQAPVQGFLSGPDALRDAVIDLQSHHAAVLVAMREAMAAVLEQFEPEHLEKELSSRSVLDALVPAHRRARLWDLYVEHSRKLRDEAKEDFVRYFNEAFRAAYESRIRQLEDAPAAEGRPAKAP